MGKIYQGNVLLGGGAAGLQEAQGVPFNNTSNNMEADNVQDAIEEVRATAMNALEAVQKFHMTITVPTQNGSLTYTGSTQSPSWNGYDTTKLTLDGTTSGTNAGSYTATFTPKTGYIWSDGTTTAKNVTWSIGRANLSDTLPTQSVSLTYTGNAQSPTWSNYDSSKMTLSVTAQTNAGTYSASFTPTANYRWSDGSTTAKSVNWAIGKAAGSLTLSKSEITLNNNTKSATFTITRSGDGAITVESSNTTVATVSLSGTTVTVNSVNDKTGTATITVKVAADTNHNAPANKTVSVSAEFAPALNDCSWDDISKIAVAGLASSYFAVGDRKAVTISGTVGTLSVSGTYYVYILGFNHNGSTGIDFGTFKTAASGGTDICLVDSNYNGYSTNGTKYFNMNHSSDTNSGGWKGCDLRYDVLGSTNTDNGDAGTTTATSPVSGTLMAALPSDLRAVMRPMTIYTDNTGGGSSTASYVTTSVDYLPLLAEYEIFGTRSYANSAEQNYQKQYAYYSAGNSKVKYCHSSTGSTASWWERSPFYSSSYSFCFVYANGGANFGTARYSIGLAPAFRV